MILLVLTMALWICWGDHLSVDSLPLIAFSYLLIQFEMVWLVWRRKLRQYFCRIFVPTFPQTNRLMILLVLTMALSICWGDHFSVDSLPFITFNYLLTQFEMVWLVWRRKLRQHFCRILFVPTFPQTNRLMILLVLTIALWICWGDHLSVDSLPLITVNYLLTQFEMVWLVWRRKLRQHFCRIFVPTFPQTNQHIILLVLTIHFKVQVPYK